MRLFGFFGFGIKEIAIIHFNFVFFQLGSGPYAEYTIGPAAILELDLAAKCQKILLSDGFSETGNVDFVKRILLDGTGLDPTQFLEVREVIIIIIL